MPEIRHRTLSDQENWVAIEKSIRFGYRTA